MVEYTYSAWGEIRSVTGSHAETKGQKNPLRYRGYYFDSETGFYATASRFYDPMIGRSINAGGYVSTGQGILGNNMLAWEEILMRFICTPNRTDIIVEHEIMMLKEYSKIISNCL